MVISEFVVQTYLQDIWEGQLNWSALKMIGFFFIFVAFPPVWFFFSLPINFRMNKIPVIKFMSYLTAHIYFMLFLTLTAVVSIFSKIFFLPSNNTRCPPTQLCELVCSHSGMRLSPSCGMLGSFWLRSQTPGLRGDLPGSSLSLCLSGSSQSPSTSQ